MNFTIAPELRRLALLLVVAALLCWYLGNLWPALLLTLGYIGFSTWQLLRLHRWIMQYPNEWEPPETTGAWGELFDGIYRMLRKEYAARDELQQLISRAESSVTALRDAVVVVDKRGRLEYWNQAAQRLLGFRHPQDRRQTFTNLVRDPRFVSYLQAGQFDHPIDLPSPLDDNIQLEYTITRFGGGEWLVLVRDVTRLHNLEQMRKDFVANVSHELKTPLTVLKGYLETLIDTAPPEQKRMQRALLQMNQQSQRMEALINDLLLLARLEGTEADKHNQRVALAPMLRRLRQDAPATDPDKNHELLLEVPPNAALLGDPAELQSAFGNLITNAVKYTPPNGRIQIRWWEDEQGGHLCVQDNGIGIDPRHIPRLTERFYRPDSSRVTRTGGTGLGLAIAKHVLLRHNSKLEIRSQPGKGSSFICHFPPHRLIQQESPAE